MWLENPNINNHEYQMIMFFGKEMKDGVTTNRSVVNSLLNKEDFFAIQPDNFNFEYTDKKNLLWHEMLLSELVDQIIIFPESPGSFTELGSFILLNNTEKIMICSEKKFMKKEDKSYIKDGAIKYLKTANKNKKGITNRSHIFTFEANEFGVISNEDVEKLLIKVIKKSSMLSTKITIQKNRTMTFKFLFYFIMASIKLLLKTNKTKIIDIVTILFQRELKRKTINEKFFLYVDNMKKTDWPNVEESINWILNILNGMNFIQRNKDEIIFTPNFKNMSFNIKTHEILFKEPKTKEEQRKIDEWIRKNSTQKYKF